MSAQTSNLFLLQDLEDASGTKKLVALRTVSDWILVPAK